MLKSSLESKKIIWVRNSDLREARKTYIKEEIGEDKILNFIFLGSFSCCPSFCVCEASY